ncbi:TonB-dependent hemoglobin/transferrin/lactoferrin family receptor [Thalassotalea sp. SU-HH00458]|uniref:TonB-dependent hemoglobin/transferrin/lactoferrin family receptor n=1 Tax=Thalassotalea sp. SU-HH00458 TaxID=3127657 RepID=UPI00310AFBF2
MFKKSLINLALAGALLPSYELLANANDVIHQGIDDETEVLVVIGKTPRKVQDVVGAVTVINSEAINQQLVHSIADLVRYEIGINVINAGSRFGDSNIAIRGISGNRIATEIDGVPVAEQFNVGSYSNSGRNTIDPDLIKQVEILRGPASSLYGSDAIGGVISYVTKKPTDLLSQTDNRVYLDLKAGHYAIDDSNAISLNTAFADGKSSALISGSLRKGHELDRHISSDFAKDSQNNETKSLLAKYHYDISDNQELSISYDYFTRENQSDIRSILGIGRFASTNLLLGDDEITRENILVTYDFVLDSAWLEGGYIRLYDQKTETIQLTEEARVSRGKAYLYDRSFFFEQDIQGLRLNFYTNVNNQHTSQHIGYGLEISNSKTTERRDGIQTNLATGDSTNTILSEVFPVRDFPISEVKETGIYINDEITLDGTNFTIIPAIRYDKYELSPKPDSIYLEDNPATEVVHISEDSISPKFSVVYQINNDSKVYLQYVKGFRAPPFEDANIGLDIPMFKMRAIPNAELKSETTHGYEVGYSIGLEQHQFNVVGFFNDYQDFIQTKVNLGFDPLVQRIIFQSQNIDNAEIYGLEFSYKGQFKNIFNSQNNVNSYANIFWSKGENKDSNQPLNEVQPNHALLGLQWLNENETFSIALNANIVDGKSDIDDPDKTLATTAGYATFDVIANYHVNDKITIAGAIYNLTNKQYWQWSDVNGFEAEDPLLATLAAAGINGSIQLKYAW